MLFHPSNIEKVHYFVTNIYKKYTEIIQNSFFLNII